MTLASQVSALATRVAQEVAGKQPLGYAGWGDPTGFSRSTMPRWAASVNTVNPLSTGRLYLTGLELKAGSLVSSVSFVSGSTAAVGLTNLWFAVYGADRTLRAITATDTSGWAAHTVKTLPLASAYTVPASGWYYLGVLGAGTTMPNLCGVSAMGQGLVMMPPIVAGNSSTGLSTPATAPATAAAITAGAAWAYALVA